MEITLLIFHSWETLIILFLMNYDPLSHAISFSTLNLQIMFLHMKFRTSFSQTWAMHLLLPIWRSNQWGPKGTLLFPELVAMILWWPFPTSWRTKEQVLNVRFWHVYAILKHTAGISHIFSKSAASCFIWGKKYSYLSNFEPRIYSLNDFHIGPRGLLASYNWCPPGPTLG